MWKLVARDAAHLIAADNLDNEQHIGEGNGPGGPGQVGQDERLDGIAERPVAGNPNRDVGHGDDRVAQGNTLVHVLLHRFAHYGLNLR